MGQAGPVIIFMVLLMAEVVLGFFIFSYAVHCFLATVQETAAGNDEVVWPDDPLQDWFWKPFYVAWLAGFSLIPFGLVFAFLQKYYHWRHPGQIVVVAVGLLLWAFFPINLLSSLSSRYLLQPINLSLFPRLIRRPVHVVVFYVLSAILWGTCTALVLPLATRRWGLAMVPLVALAGASAILIYGRLVGRLGWVLSRVRIRQKPRALRPEDEPPEPVERPTAVSDPWSLPMPPEETGTPVVIRSAWDDEPVVGYTLSKEEPPALVVPIGPGDNPGPVMPQSAAQDSGPVNPDPPAARAPRRKKRAARDGKPPARKEKEQDEEPPPRKERIRHVAPPPPEWALASGVFSFPWYPSTLRAWLWITAGLLSLGVLFHIQMGFAGFLRD